MKNIKIGTLVPGSLTCGKYMESMLPFGFETFSLTWWQSFQDAPPEKILPQVKHALAGTDVTISSLSVFGNLLEETEIDKISLKHFKEAIDWAPEFGCDLVTGFTGRISGKPIPESMERLKQVWTPLIEYAASKHVRIAFENCNMNGNWQSGSWNTAITPDAWEMIFAALPAENLGLQWEPCHQMTLLIDPLPQIEDWGHKFFNIHGKDATVRRHIIARHGFGGQKDVVWHRHPGFGDSDWTQIISELRRVGYQGSIDIEGWHDLVYQGDLEITGQVHALNYLKRCRGGDVIQL